MKMFSAGVWCYQSSATSLNENKSETEPKAGLQCDVCKEESRSSVIERCVFWVFSNTGILFGKQELSPVFPPWKPQCSACVLSCMSGTVVLELIMIHTCLLLQESTEFFWHQHHILGVCCYQYIHVTKHF